MTPQDGRREGDGREPTHKIVDRLGVDVTELRRPWSYADGINQAPRTTGLLPGDRIYANDGRLLHVVA